MTPPRSASADALAKFASVVILFGLSLVTFSYQRALEPLYGQAATYQNLNKIVWSACILGSFAPTLPIWPAVLASGVFLCAMPHTAYWVAVYTARLGSVIWGPVITHLSVLTPVLYLGVAVIKALQEQPQGDAMVQNVSTQAITLPVCQTAIMTLQGLWSEIQFLQAIGDSQIFLQLGSMAIAVYALYPFLAPTPETVQEPQRSEVRPVISSPKPKSKGKSSVTQTSPPKPSQRKSRFSTRLLPVFILPILPILTSTILRAPTLPKPLKEPYTHPSYPLRILSSVQSAYSGVIVVGEAIAQPESDSSLHSLRYLRAGHSLLGGVWIGDKVMTKQNAKPWLVDEQGQPLGDSIYSAFVLQEAIRLAIRPKSDGAQENALMIGLGTGIAASAFARHGVPTTIVEIDPAVYDAAKRFFGLPAPEPNKLFLEDARLWVRERRLQLENETAVAAGDAPELFDMIVHDCFSGGGVPPHMFTLQFWEDLKAVMQPDGVVAVNYAGPLISQPAQGIVITLQKAFGQCRAFRDSFEDLSEEQLRTEFINWVFFCSPSAKPIMFRPPTDADYLDSYLREHVLSSLPRREVELEMVTNEVPEDKRENYVLTDTRNNLGEWQKKEALKHWGVMREVLPNVFWETY